MSEIKVSDQAQDYFRKIIAKQNFEGLCIRLGVVNPETPGVQCSILYCPKEYVTPQDIHFQMQGFEVVIDSDAMPYLEQSVIDLDRDEQGEEILTFHAPNLHHSVLPENASLKDKLQHFIEHVVAPNLAAHGGAVSLEDVTEDGVVKVRFLGGCLGCSMAGITVSENIEVQLKQAFPGQVTRVEDVTQHVKTDETYA
ncbi:MAG: NifU family protein [Succinivibrio sp.]|nr:NifU family protein [Succinivibrio sp.]